MRSSLVLTLVGLLPAAAAAQQPKKADAALVDSIVNRMMAFDKNKDGKLTRDEITDPRLLRLFDRADTNKDGVVTREELAALATQLAAEQGQGGKGKRGPDDDSGGPGFGPPGDGPKGFGPGRGPGKKGPGGFGQPRPGQVLPPFLQEELKLTDAQKRKIEALQKEVDTKLEQILTDIQNKQLQDMRERRPRGPGGPGGPPPGRREPPPEPPDELSFGTPAKNDVVTRPQTLL
jgi:hypothetical protein